MIRKLNKLMLKIVFIPLWLLMLIVFLVSCLYKKAFNKDLSMLDEIKLYRLIAKELGLREYHTGWTKNIKQCRDTYRAVSKVISQIGAKQ